MSMQTVERERERKRERERERERVDFSEVWNLAQADTTYKRELPHVVSFFETKNEPNNSRYVHTKRDESMVRDQRSKILIDGEVRSEMNTLVKRKLTARFRRTPKYSASPSP